MTELSPRLGLPFLMADQAQKHVTHNEALLRLDHVTQLTVEGFDATDPPLEPVEGQVWALGPAPSGDWTGQGGNLALWVDGAWQFVTPAPGWRAAQGTALRIFDGTGWVAPDLPALQDLPGVGINATSDATNRLTVSAPATLLTHEGAGHQLKINRAASADTASLLFQTGFSGRVEMGIAGSDDFSVKVSADGSDWFDALTANRANGLVSLPSGLIVWGDLFLPPAVFPGLRTAYGGSANAVALTTGASLSSPPMTGLELRFRASETNTEATTIALDGGTPIACRTITGVALPPGYIRTDADTVARFDGSFWILGRQIQRGNNANGQFTRFASGLQICRLTINAGARNAFGSGTWADPYRTSALTTQPFPAAFSSTPVVEITPLINSDTAAARALTASVQSVSSTAIQRPQAFAIGDNTSSTTVTLHIYAIGNWFDA